MCVVNYKLALAIYLSTSARIKPCAAEAADLQYPPKGIQGGEKKRGTLCSGKNWQDRAQVFRYLDIFRS